MYIWRFVPFFSFINGFFNLININGYTYVERSSQQLGNIKNIGGDIMYLAIDFLILFLLNLCYDHIRMRTPAKIIKPKKRHVEHLKKTMHLKFHHVKHEENESLNFTIR